VEDILNELATTVLLASTPLDEPTYQSIVELLRSVESGSNARITQAAEYVATQIKSDRKQSALELLNAFVSAAQQVLSGREGVTLPGEVREGAPATSASTSGSVEVSPDITKEFLIEFIEKHTLMMEELEGWLVDYRTGESILTPEDKNLASEELQRQVKGYLHNVKGDAGSVGIYGIERVCHFIEDKLTDIPVVDAIDPILEFKAWALDCMKALSEQRGLPLASAQFIERIGAVMQVQRRSESTETSEFGENANLDLLAELMGDAPLPEEANKASQDESAGYALEGDSTIFPEFVAEAEDHLSNVESIILEANGTYSSDAINSIFRSIHSIKGSCSYFGLKEVAETSHKTENLLDEVRNGKRPFNPELTALILHYLDLQRQLIRRAREAAHSNTLVQRLDDTQPYLKELDDLVKGKAAPAAAPVAPAASAESSESGAKGEKLEVKSYIKVDTRRLDQLIDAIGEMGIYSSMLIEKARYLLSEDESTLKVTHQLEKFVRDLQYIGMSMRLVPIRGLFQKMSRLVWDLSRKIGKDIKLVTEGEDTELDRTLIDILADPLMHMIRNALDHGVEPPDEREQAGKHRQGNVRLSAFHANGSIHIKIQDDGRGLNPEKLIKKAIEKGIVRPEQKLTNEEAFALIFAPGFSTAAQVTDVSGRGVGMDVVKRNIESIRGRIKIESVVGKGTIFTIELPLTLAVLDGIVVSIAGEKYIIPVLSIIEFMRPTPEMITKTCDRGETFSFRGKYLPLFRLSEILELKDSGKEPTEGNVIVLETQGAQFAIVVDEIVGSYSTVIKSLGEMYSSSQGLAGCTIMSTGDVCLILDVSSLLVLARDTYQHRVRKSEAPLIDHMVQ
jgi:two-component system chemotaxis sensor kinase CheA